MMMTMIAMMIQTNKMKMKTQIIKSVKENLQANLIIKKIKKYSVIEKQGKAFKFSRSTVVIKQRNKE